MAVAADDSKEPLYWSMTTLNYRALEKGYVNDVTCRKNLNHFWGCVEAVEYLFAVQKDIGPVVLASPLHTVAAEDVLLEVGGLRVAKDRNYLDIKERKLPVMEAVRVRKAHQKNWDKIWTDAFAKQARNISFSAALRQAMGKLESANEPMYAGYAINHVLKNIEDPHTYLIPRAKMEADDKNPGENYVGIGAQMRPSEDGIFVDTVFESSPAEKAGLKENDLIVEIITDGKSTATESIDLDSAIKLIKGPAGTTVQLVVRRGSDTLTLSIVRAPVQMRNVRTKEFDYGNGRKIGYVRIDSFAGDATCEEFSLAMLSYNLDPKFEGAIVDLRSNLGGRLDIAVCMLDLFLPENRVVISIVNPRTNEITKYAKTGGADVYFTKSLAVLINGYSASASEIFAGVVQDYRLGHVVGARSFGKGTVQAVNIDFNYQGVLRAQTTGRFHLPSGRTNQLVGILPDFEAYLSPEPKAEEMYFEREEDLYRNIIPTGDTKRTVFHPRKEATEACVRSQGNARQRYRKGMDYMVLMAQDVVMCDAAAAASKSLAAVK